MPSSKFPTKTFGRCYESPKISLHTGLVVYEIHLYLIGAHKSANVAKQHGRPEAAVKTRKKMKTKMRTTTNQEHEERRRRYLRCCCHLSSFGTVVNKKSNKTDDRKEAASACV